MNALLGVAIRAITAAVPKSIALTQEYEFISPIDRTRLEKATGIIARRISPVSQCASDLCAAAANRLMNHLNWSRDSIGGIVLITQTADQPIPATSIVLQHKLGLPQTCVAFDVNLGCSAYPFGLGILGSMMRTLGISRALLLMGDVSSRVCAKHDKSTWPLFGDAGSATALELCADASPIYLDLMTDGEGKDAIIVPSGGLASRTPSGSECEAEESGPDGIKRRPDNLRLRGADVFSFAISKVPPSIARVLAAAKSSAECADFLVLHQANKMINDTIARKTGFTTEQNLSSLSEYGNTSSASIPLTISAHSSLFKRRTLIAISGFGVGLSWGSGVLTLEGDVVIPPLESDDVY